MVRGNVMARPRPAERRGSRPAGVLAPLAVCVGLSVASWLGPPAASAQAAAPAGSAEAETPAGSAEAATPAADSASVAWMAGCWVAEGGGRRVDEVWMAPEGGLMVGMSRSVRDGTARGWELLLLGERGGVLTYSALPSGQALTHFAATAVEPDRARFENPEHDFPKAIEYVRPTPDSLVARVFGDVDAAEPAFAVRYGRGVCPGG